MGFGKPHLVALVIGALAFGCGNDTQATGGTSGSGGGLGGSAGEGASGGDGGIGGADPNLCALGLCMDDEALSADCLEVYDACVGRGHYAWACRLDADETCGL